MSILCIFIVFLSVLICPLILQTKSDSRNLSSSSEATCAILFFGIGRKFRSIAFSAIERNILSPNPTCDIFVHTFNITRAQGSRQGEDGTGIINASELYLLASDSSRVMFESERDFQLQRNVTYFRSLFPVPSAWDYPTSMDNMIRQWHSIEKVWSKMEAYEEKNYIRYDVVGLFRPDVLFTHPILIKEPEPAIIPQLMYQPQARQNSWGGYNDRMFYGKREYAKCWATERFNSVQAYLKWQNFNEFYSRKKKGLHSEDFLRWLLVFQWPVPLTMKPICFMRIRSSGETKNDCELLSKYSS